MFLRRPCIAGSKRAHPSDPNFYLVCQFKRYYLWKCPHSHIYVSQMNECVNISANLSRKGNSVKQFIAPPIARDLNSLHGPCLLPGEMCVQGKRYGEPEDCSVYWLCVFGRFKKNICQGVLLFDVNKGTCVWPEQAQCQGPCPTTTTNTGPTTTVTVPASGTVYARLGRL